MHISAERLEHPAFSTPSPTTEPVPVELVSDNYDNPLSGVVGPVLGAIIGGLVSLVVALLVLSRTRRDNEDLAREEESLSAARELTVALRGALRVSTVRADFVKAQNQKLWNAVIYIRDFGEVFKRPTLTPGRLFGPRCCGGCWITLVRSS